MKGLRFSTISSGLRITAFSTLLALGFTSCQDEVVSPDGKSGNNNVVMPADKPTSDGKPPHEPDYGG